MSAEQTTKMSRAIRRRRAAVLSVFGALSVVHVARAEASQPKVSADRAAKDGVYDRFDGDLDLGLGLGAEFGSTGPARPTVRGSAHYFSIAGVYLAGRLGGSEDSTPALLSLGLDLRPLFVPRWGKGFELGPRLFDLMLDSLSLSLGAFWESHDERTKSQRGLDAQLGFGVPVLLRAAGPWLEIRGALRYPDAAGREEALLLALAFHGFVTTPFSSPP